MNRYIHKLIQEQFNINDLDLSNDTAENNVTIFNKEPFDYHEIYNKIADRDNKYDFPVEAEIEYMDTLVSVIMPKDAYELRHIVVFYSKYFNTHSLNWLDVSNIATMQHMFNDTTYDGDISMWDVSGATNMTFTFKNSEFTGDISNWNVSNVKDMSWMFSNSKFDNDISRWDVSNVENMSYMFNASVFNKDISKWDVSNV